MTSTILLSPPLTELAGLARVQARLSPAYTAAGVKATGTLTSDNTNVTDQDTCTIGAKTYTFTSAAPATEGEVQIGADADATLLNLIRAINHTGTADTDYKCAAVHPTVTAAAAVASHTVVVTAITGGVAGNSLASTEASTHLSWGAATLAGGVDPTAVVVLPISVPAGTTVTASLNVRASAGVVYSAAATASAAADTLTVAAGHGFVTGQAVYVVGSGQPGGVTATTLYYVNVSADTLTLKLFTTQALAVLNGTPVDITTAGTSVVVSGVPICACYVVQSAARNRNGNTTLIGSTDLVAFEDVSAWALTAVANSTTDTIDVTFLGDIVLPCAVEVTGVTQTLSSAV